MQDLGVDVTAIQDLLDQEDEDQGNPPEADAPDSTTPSEVWMDSDLLEDIPETGEPDVPPMDAGKPGADARLPDAINNPLPEAAAEPEPAEDAGQAGRTDFTSPDGSPRGDTATHPDATIPQSPQDSGDGGCYIDNSPNNSRHFQFVSLALLAFVTLMRKRKSHKNSDDDKE